MNSNNISQANPSDLIDSADSILREIRKQRPRIHCIANSVAEPLAANTLLAIGAIPSMTADPEEIGDFVKSADAVSINLGTPTGPRRAARRIAIDEATYRGIPWTLDPVMADRSSARRREAEEILRQAPTAVRLNSREAQELAEQLSRYRGTVAITGPVDRITTGPDATEITTGHPLMDQVTAMGCALTTIVTAFLAIGPECRHTAVAAAVLSYGAAGRAAGRSSAGPGSFPVQFLDTLAGLDGDAIRTALEEE